MKNIQPSLVLTTISIFMTLLLWQPILAQNQTNTPNNATPFWDNVQFGGGIGLGFANGTTNISLSPSAIYNLSEYASLGLGVQYSYAREKNSYTSNLYGGSIIGLVNPFEQIQLSAELEQLRVNVDYGTGFAKENFWNTGLFLGAGFRNGNVTFGARYNVLHKENNNIYGEAFMPFVRVFF